MREIRGEVGKKTPKKRWIIPHYYDVKWMIFDTILTKFGLCPINSFTIPMMTNKIDSSADKKILVKKR